MREGEGVSYRLYLREVYLGQVCIPQITATNYIFGSKSRESRRKTLFRTTFVFYTFPGSDQKGLKFRI